MKNYKMLKDQQGQHLWYERLWLELRKNNISYKTIAKLINTDEYTVQNKIHGIEEMTLADAELIQKNFFPHMPIEILFTVSTISKYNPITKSYIFNGYEGALQ